MQLSTFTCGLLNRQSPTTQSDQVAEVNRAPAKKYFSVLDPDGVPDPKSLTRRTCRSRQAADRSPGNREQLGGKGMFLQRMKEAGLSVPPFKCVTAQVMNALEQHPVDTHRLARYLPGIDPQWGTETSLTNIREYLNTLPPSEQTKRNNWLAGLAQFIVSDDYYEQVKDSDAAQHIRELRRQLDRSSKSKPVIVRSSGINEDNYGDAQAGKYLSKVQNEDDVLLTCLEVMASGYRPEVCPEGAPQPMALIIQECIDCLYGGVGTTFQSFQDKTIRFEYTRGQPRGAVAGQSGNTPHRIDIFREDRKKEAGRSQYFPGRISSHFILEKHNNGYSEKRIADADAQSNEGGQRLPDKMVSKIRKALTKLENLLLCPVDAEFAIDPEGGFFVVQVRPVTQLSGDMVFAMPIPEEALAIGEGISEGFCTGPLWLAKRQAADSMPKGAIVVADHAEDWMLERKFLERAGGFVLAEAGFNDHVAIVLKQEKVPLMRAGEQFAALATQDGQQATLACARFNGEPGAFIVAGDLSGKLASHRSLSTAFSDEPSAEAVPSRDDLTPPEGTFLQVASAFQWLSDQNARLLALFAPGGGLDCLANPVKLSMSPQRSELLAKTQDSVIRLVGGAEALLDGYGAFLSLAGNGDLSQLKPKRKELPQLSKRFEMLKQTIQSVLKRIILPMQAAEKGQAYPRDFCHWVADCHQLRSCLQALNPESAVQVRSVHELIFALHQRFIEALAPVTLESGQGRLTEERVRDRSNYKQRITFVDCTTPGKSGEKAPLLSPSVKESIWQLARETTVISMDDALIVNLKLGAGGHVGLVELLENAEGGKGRTLRLKFSDDFDAAYSNGKFQRVWFLAQLLKAIKLDENAAGMKLACNPVARELIVEYPGMKTREAMQAAFKKLMIVLEAIFAFDIAFEKAVILEESRWDFNLLAQRLNPDVTVETDAFNFQHCIFAIPYLKIDRLTISPACCQLLNNHLQQIVHFAEQLHECRKLVVRGEKPQDSLREIFRSDELSESTRRQLIHHFFLLEAHYSIPPFEDFYDRYRDQYYILKPTRDFKPTFAVPPSQSLSDIKEEVSKALAKNGLKDVSQRIRGDKELVLEAIITSPEKQRHFSEELKEDKDVAIALVSNCDCELGYLRPKFKDDYDVVKAAVKKFSRSLQFASERIRSDKDFIKELVAIDVECLMDVEASLLSDREYMLDLIAVDPGAIEYAALKFMYDQTFIDAAKLRNPKVIRYIGGRLENIRLTLTTWVDEMRCGIS
ncbi:MULTISPECIES: PEP/pyruvate-binding domain-containing protein [unclassified Endozoicomonas]|uniref:PEP/pyruvate-binding domain-containing protein n=1 Tax=unclassified Endozoicomonas TaxID=2644528 RepID=UPI003BB5FE0E